MNREVKEEEEENLKLGIILFCFGAMLLLLFAVAYNTPTDQQKIRVLEEKVKVLEDNNGQ